MQYSPIRRTSPKKEEYDIDIDNDEQLHSDDDENTVILHHGDLHGNTHDNIFGEHHVMTPSMEETHHIMQKEEDLSATKIRKFIQKFPLMDFAANL